MASELEGVASATNVDPHAQKLMLALYEQALGELQRGVQVRAFTHQTPDVPEEEDADVARLMLERYYATR